MPWFQIEGEALGEEQIRGAVTRLLEEARTRIKRDLRRVLLLPPDLTRAHSGAGRITEMLYEGLAGSEVAVIPTLGQHQPHTEEENRWMFGSIPHRIIYPHDWREGCDAGGNDSGVDGGGDDRWRGGLGDPGGSEHEADELSRGTW